MHETDVSDSTFEPSEPEDKDWGVELPYPQLDTSRSTPPETAESVPTDSFSNVPLSHGSPDDSELSVREAYLIRSYIQKIAAVVSLLPAADMEHGLNAAGRYL